MKPIMMMGRGLLLARLSLMLLSSLTAEAFLSPQPRVIAQPFVTSYCDIRSSKLHYYSKRQRLKSYRSDDGDNDGSVDKERKEKYLSLAEQAWTRFFAKEDSKATGDSNSLDIRATGKPGEHGKDDYLKMALNAWDSASSNSYRERAVVVDTYLPTVDNAATCIPQEAPNKFKTQNLSTGDSNLLLDLATSRMFDATSAFLDKLRGGKTDSDNVNDDSKETTSVGTATSTGTAMADIQEDDESIPYGLRVKAASNTKIYYSEAEMSNKASNKAPNVLTNGRANTSNGMHSSSSKTKSARNDSENNTLPAIKGFAAKQQRNMVKSGESFANFGLKGTENRETSVATINTRGIDRKQNRTDGPSTNFQEAASQGQSKIDIASNSNSKSSNLGAGSAVTKNTINTPTTDESNDSVKSDTKSQSGVAEKLKVNKTKLVRIGARESILTSGLKSQKGRVPKLTGIDVNGADEENEVYVPSETSKSTDGSISLKGDWSSESTSAAKQSNEKLFLSTLKSPKGGSTPFDEQFLARSFLSSLKTPKPSEVGIEGKLDNVEGSISTRSPNRASSKDSAQNTSLNRGALKDSTSVIKQPESGNAFLSSLNTSEGSPTQKHLIARSYLNSLKSPVQKTNVYGEQSEYSYGGSSSASKFGIDSTFSAGVKLPIKGSNPSFKTTSGIRKVGVDSALPRKEIMNTAKNLDDNSLPSSNDPKEVVSSLNSMQFFSPEKTQNIFSIPPSITMKGKESSASASKSNIAVDEGIKIELTTKAGLGSGDAKIPTSRLRTSGAHNTKTPSSADELEMNMSGPPGNKNFASNQQTDYSSGTSFVQGLKGSDPAAETKPPFGQNGATNSFAPKQLTVDASRTSLTARLKMSDSGEVYSQSTMAGLNMKVGDPFPDKAMTNAQSDGTVGSEFSVVKSTNVDRSGNPKLKGLSKQPSFDILNTRSYSDLNDSVAKGVSHGSEYGFEATPVGALGEESFFMGDNAVQDTEDSFDSQNFFANTNDIPNTFTSDVNQEVFEANYDLPDVESVEEEDLETIFESADPNDLTVLLSNIDAASLPLLRVGARVHSSVFGATHQGYLVIPKENDETGYNVLPCTAKRPWTMAELKSNVVAKFTTGTERVESPEDWEVQMTAGKIRNYFEVEYHCYQKFDQMKHLRMLLRRQAEADRANSSQAQTENDPAASNSEVLEFAVPKFLGIYQDDGKVINESDFDVWGKQLDNSYEWMVYSGGGISGIQASLDQHVAVSQDDPHHLYSVQKALNLPEWLRFGDVMDVLMRSLLENLVFLTSCNIVHRDIQLSNINCDFEKQRLQLINFGNAVDLDPKEGKRVGLDTRSSSTVTLGSIANSFAEDSFSTAMVLCQLLFNLMDEASVKNFQKQIKEASYDLDAWLKNQLENSGYKYSPEDIPALEYLGERRGAWGLLKRLIQPNPLQRKLAVNSFERLKEIMGLRDGTIQWTDDFIVRVATEEAYLETLIDSFGQDLNDVDDISISSRGKVDSDSSPYYELIDSTEQISQSELDQTSASDVPGHLKVTQAASNGATVNPARVRNNGNSDVYYDITRSKLTSKFPPSKPSILSSLLSSGIRSVSPPATATEIAAQENTKAYDITRASLGTANPYATVPRKQSTIQPTKEFLNRSEGTSSEVDDAPSKSSALLTTTPIPTDEDKRTSLEKSEEVGRWILSYLPRLQKQDLQCYVNCLIADGFDSYDMLRELVVDDLDFMKKGHKRVLVRKLEVERKLDSELDPSSRKRIELLLVEVSSKKMSDAMDTRVPYTNPAPNIGEELAPELVTNQNRSTGEAALSVANVRAVSNNTAIVDIPESTPLAYDIFEAEEEMEEAKKGAAEIKRPINNSQLNKLDLTGESSRVTVSEQSIMTTTSPTPALAYNISQAGEELKEAEAWIEEQNRLMEVRRIARSTSRHTNVQLQGKVAKKMVLDVKPTSSDVDSKEDLNTTSAGVKNEFAQKFSTNPDVLQSRLAEEVSDEDRSAWYKEQNILVEKRRLARLEEERQLRKTRQL